MPTIKQLASSQRTTSGSQSAQITTEVQGANIKEGQIIDKGAKLAKDLGLQLGGVVKTAIAANESAGKRVGTELLAEYSEGMSNINTVYAEKEGKMTSQDYKDKTDAEQKLYQSMMTRGTFDGNELANDGFKSSFGKQATGLLFATKRQNEVGWKKALLSETYTDEKNLTDKHTVVIDDNTKGKFLSTYDRTALETSIANINRVGGDVEEAYKNGVDTQEIALKQQLKDVPEQVLAGYKNGTLFNDFFSPFGKVVEKDFTEVIDGKTVVHKAGSLVKTDQNMPDKQWERILDSYGKLETIAKEVATYNPLPTQVSQINLTDSEEVITTVGASIEKRKGIEQATLGKVTKTTLKAMQNFSIKEAQRKNLSHDYIAYKTGTTPSPVNSTASFINPNNGESITTSANLEVKERDTQLNKMASAEMELTLKNPDVSKVDAMVDSFAEATKSGHAFSAVTQKLTSLDHGASSIKTSTEFLNTVRFIGRANDRGANPSKNQAYTITGEMANAVQDKYKTLIDGGTSETEALFRSKLFLKSLREERNEFTLSSIKNGGQGARAYFQTEDGKSDQKFNPLLDEFNTYGTAKTSLSSNNYILNLPAVRNAKTAEDFKTAYQANSFVYKSSMFGGTVFLPKPTHYVKHNGQKMSIDKEDDILSTHIDDVVESKLKGRHSDADVSTYMTSSEIDRSFVVVEDPNTHEQVTTLVFRKGGTIIDSVVMQASDLSEGYSEHYDKTDL